MRQVIVRVYGEMREWAWEVEVAGEVVASGVASGRGDAVRQGEDAARRWR